MVYRGSDLAQHCPFSICIFYSFYLHRRDTDAEVGLGDLLSEVSNPSSSQPLQAAEAPNRKRKAVANQLQVPVAIFFDILFSDNPSQGSVGSADFMSPRERILALRDSKKAKRSAAAAPSARAVTTPADADSGNGALVGEWPLAAITESLVADLLSPTWFVRHGCALGLIEILTVAGSVAGCCDGLDAAQQLAANADYLGGVAACLLVVLALDRYADFDSQVLLPINFHWMCPATYHNTHL